MFEMCEMKGENAECVIETLYRHHAGAGGAGGCLSHRHGRAFNSLSNKINHPATFKLHSTEAQCSGAE